MKVTIIGHLAKSGTSSKSGTPKPWAIGELYIMVPFSARDEGAKGFMSMTRRCPPELIKTIQHLPVPLQAELEIQDVIVFGKPEVEVIAIKPIAREEKVLKAA